MSCNEIEPLALNNAKNPKKKHRTLLIAEKNSPQYGFSWKTSSCIIILTRMTMAKRLEIKACRFRTRMLSPLNKNLKKWLG